MNKDSNIKSATRRLQRQAARTRLINEIRAEYPVLWALWRIVSWPFRMIGRFLRWLWRQICRIDLVGLINLTLLIAIIFMFCMLVLEITHCKHSAPVVRAQPVPITVKSAPARTVLPATKKPVVAKSAPDNVKIVEEKVNTIQNNGVLYGDIVIDNRGDAVILQNGGVIKGNLYLQDMRKYTLPCGIKIDGDLFLRDIGLLQFCGDFTVTGNIYVSSRTSFGPIPRNAHLGGQIIL